MANTLTLKSIYGGQLVPIDQVRGLLDAELDPARVADFVKSLEVAKKIDAKNNERRTYWGALGLWSARRLAQLIIQGQDDGAIADGNGRPKKVSPEVTLITLGDLGISRNDSAKAQRILSVPADELEAYIVRQVEAGKDVTKAGAIRLASPAKESPDGELPIAEALARLTAALNRIFDRWPKDCLEAFAYKLRAEAESVLETQELIPQ